MPHTERQFTSGAVVRDIVIGVEKPKLLRSGCRLWRDLPFGAAKGCYV